MEIVVSERDTVMVVTVAGRMETDDAFRLKQKLGELRHAGARFFVIDLQSILFLNSYALGILIHIRRETKNASGEVVLASPEDNIKLLFNMVGLGQIIKIFPTVDKAIQQLKQVSVNSGSSNS